ncbi:hypothetical protein ACWDUL_10730 [Nocardia niigatensis]|uniref:hypothetical protein n=1 Tax=Nocardia niigatensis TaxID=209249 RepID=UPI0002FFCBC5|nr:hypothetical protein [Nocardia niigatensis]
MIVELDTVGDVRRPRFEERSMDMNNMDMQSPLMQVCHTVMMWLHQQGILPPMTM